MNQYREAHTSTAQAEEADIAYKAELIREKRQLIRNENKMRKSLKNRAVIPRSKKAVELEKMEKSLQNAGYDTSAIATRVEEARSKSRPRGRSQAPTDDGDAMDVDATPKERVSRSMSVLRQRSQSKNRRDDGVTNELARTKADRMQKLGQKKMNRMARQGEADRHTTAAKSKWLLAGKRGMGSTRSR